MTDTHHLNSVLCVGVKTDFNLKNQGLTANSSGER